MSCCNKLTMMRSWSTRLLAMFSLLAVAAAPLAQQKTQAQPRVSVRVEVGPALASRVRPQDVVYVFARGLTGPGMPLATVRIAADTLPVTVVLDDSMGAMSSEKLSAHAKVEVVARISRSGDASARDGDLQGSVGPVDVGAKASAHVLVDRVISGRAVPHEAAQPPAHPQSQVAARLELAPEVSSKWKSVTLLGPAQREFDVDIGSSAALADSGAKLEVLGFVPAFMIDDGVVTSASNEPSNPAVLIRITQTSGTQTQGWVFQKYPQFNTFKHQSLAMQLIKATPR